jgi:hypothetical protein
MFLWKVGTCLQIQTVLQPQGKCQKIAVVFIEIVRQQLHE